jgi:TolA-binding protein
VIGPESSPTRRDGSVTRHTDSGSGDPGRLSSVSSPANSGTISRLPGHPLATTPEGLQKPERKPWALPQLPAVLRRPPVLAGLGAALLILIGLSAWALMRTGGRPSEKDSRLKQQAIQLWQDQQFDQSEQLWRQLAQTKGALRTEAIRQVNQIEQKRGEEQRRFDEGEGLLKDKQYAAAQPAFQEVINMSLWHSAEAARELEVAKRAVGEEDIHNQEKDHFDLGVQLFQNKDFEKARREFEAARDVKVPNSALRPQIDGFLKKIAQNGDAKKLYQLALEDIKKEDWDGAQQQLQEVVNRKGELSGQAKQRLGDVAAAQKAEATFHQSLRTGTYRDAKIQLDAMQQWPKTRDRLLTDLHSAERQEANDIQARANTLQANDDVNGLERLKEELHKFAGRVEDPNLARWATQEFDPWLNNAEQKLIGKRTDKAAFDAAVAHFEQARQRKDTGQLGHAVIQEFQKIASGQGAYREQAQIYVKSTIPNTIQELTQTKGKVSLSPILCGPGQASQTLPSIAGAVSCAQLDPGNPLHWLGTPLVNLPENAKLPYTLNLIVTVDPEGNVKIEKDGNAEKDFLKKAKDASKHWKTTAPKSGGKPVTVRFSYSITFR